jgi:di/tricarboxylate transporter
MTNSGLSAQIRRVSRSVVVDSLDLSTALVELFGGSEIGLLFGLYLSIMILNAFVSNSASVSLIFPVRVLVIVFVSNSSEQIAYQIALDSQSNGGVITVRMVVYMTMVSERVCGRDMSDFSQMAGSCDFATPIGVSVCVSQWCATCDAFARTQYQTNLMVYSVGGYHFFDYAKVGIPLQLLVCVTSVFVCYYVYRY